MPGPSIFPKGGTPSVRFLLVERMGGQNLAVPSGLPPGLSSWTSSLFFFCFFFSGTQRVRASFVWAHPLDVLGHFRHFRAHFPWLIFAWRRAEVLVGRRPIPGLARFASARFVAAGVQGSRSNERNPRSWAPGRVFL